MLLGFEDGGDDSLQEYAGDPCVTMGGSWRPWSIWIGQEAGEKVQQNPDERCLGGRQFDQ